MATRSGSKRNVGRGEEPHGASHARGRGRRQKSNDTPDADEQQNRQGVGRGARSSGTGATTTSQRQAKSSHRSGETGKPRRSQRVRRKGLGTAQGSGRNTRGRARDSEAMPIDQHSRKKRGSKAGARRSSRAK